MQIKQGCENTMKGHWYHTPISARHLQPVQSGHCQHPHSSFSQPVAAFAQGPHTHTHTHL